MIYSLSEIKIKNNIFFKDCYYMVVALGNVSFFVRRLTLAQFDC
jgi:hypothetical protein